MNWIILGLCAWTALGVTYLVINHGGHRKPRPKPSHEPNDWTQPPWPQHFGEMHTCLVPEKRWDNGDVWCCPSCRRRYVLIESGWRCLDGDDLADVEPLKDWTPDWQPDRAAWVNGSATGGNLPEQRRPSE